MTKTIKKIAIAGAIGLSVLVILLISYVVYAYVAYYRIDDNQVLEVFSETPKRMSVGGTYTAVAYNIGFGAYCQDYSFFMDGGKESVARSRANVLENVRGSINILKELNPDFALIQEVDIKATRSYRVNQNILLKEAFPDFTNTFAVNYDSPFLAYPLLRPHGKSLAGISTFSRYKIQQAIRRSLPVSETFSKFFDLDRCYSVNQIPLDNGKSLYLYNAHLSAYGGTPEIRAAQINRLFSDMAVKYTAGDYVLCGGDFNHDLPGDSVARMNKKTELSWAQPFPHEMLPSGIHFAGNYVNPDSPTVRDCDMGYVAGVTNIAIVDGFFASDNVEIFRTENVHKDFLYSDHNPVALTFRLKP